MEIYHKTLTRRREEATVASAQLTAQFLEIIMRSSWAGRTSVPSKTHTQVFRSSLLELLVRHYRDRQKGKQDPGRADQNR